jgi:hypothetical protein
LLLNPPFFGEKRWQESLWRSWIWIADPDGGESALPGGHAVGVVVSIGASEMARKTSGTRGDLPSGYG